MKEMTPQQREALEYRRHISLTANAGSGKTFLLSKRFVEIFLNEEIELSSIAAITFTDKAAGELGKKIAVEIDERILTEIDRNKKRKLENLRRQLVSANISTIHSFCINILKEFAPEAQIDANFIPIDETTANELIELSAEETLHNLIKNQSYEDDLKYLIRLFGSKNIFSAQLKKAVQQRKIIKRLADGIYLKTEKEIAEYFSAEFEKKFIELFGEIIPENVERIRRINNKAHEQSAKHAAIVDDLLKKMSPQLSIYNLLSILKKISDEIIVAKEGTLRKVNYLTKGKDELKNEILEVEVFFEELKNFFDADITGKANHELALFGKSFIKIFNYTDALYASKKKQKGWLDFEDILLFTHDILQRQDVQQYLHNKFAYIMIDEYQDTNELQYEIFMPVLNYLQRGNLFVVGDEKQSIYMFRDAELEIFSRTKNEIKMLDSPGMNLTLPHSFRMAPQLVLFTNKIFSNLFKEPQQQFNEVVHSNLICAKDEIEQGQVSILLSEENSVTSESEMVARKIIWLTREDADVQFKDCAILCRKRDAFKKLERTFVQFGIPYTIVGGKGFYQRQTIYDIYNYLSFIMNNNDDAALTGILRSPFFNLSDLTIFEISRQIGNSFFEKLRSLSQKKDYLKDVSEKLIESSQLAANTEIYSIIRKILLESGYWAVIAAKNNSAQELANVEKLLSLARNFSKKAFKNLYDFTLFLKESIEGYEDEGQAQVARDENTVKLMTIHKAKGLEFKAVFLFETNEKSQQDSVRAKFLNIDKNFGLLTKVPIDNNYFSKYSTPPIVSYFNYVIKRKNKAELKRLFYVAVTRAINYLFVSATHKEFKPANGSLFHLLTEGMQNDLKQNEINITDEVEFMRFIGSDFKFDKKPLSLTLKIESKPEEEIKTDTAISNEEKKIFLTKKIKDVPKQEIISATKISMFTQCPVKYELTYVLGYSTIYQLVKEQMNDFDYNPNEDDELRPFAQLRGKIIHAALKNELHGIDLRNFVSSRIDAESNFENKRTKESLSRAVIDEIEKYYSSAVYNGISSKKNCMNEYEVYSVEGEHYLYGIIDKLIIEKEKLTIIDYKTDNVSSEQLMARSADYLPQLKFYAYILSKLYTDHDSYELQLIFLKHAEQTLSWKINRDDLKPYSAELREAINKIFASQFNPNLLHCSKCHFALEGFKCVKTIS